MSNTDAQSYVRTAVIRGMENEGIRSCIVHILYNVMNDNYDIRVDHPPSGNTINHCVESRDMESQLDNFAVKVVNPLVMKMLEALT